MARPKKHKRGRGTKPVRQPSLARQQAAPASVDLSAHDGTLADLKARLLTDEVPDAETLAAGLDELRALGDPVSGAALDRLAREGGAHAIPTLEAALSDEVLVLNATRALAHVADPEAARLLDGIAREHPNKAVAKAARRSLYELRRAGVVWESPADETPREEWPLYKAIVSHIDGEGTRSIWIARRGAFGGLRVANFVLNEALGIKDCYGVDDFGQVDFDRIIEEGAVSEPPIIYAEVGLPRARRLVEEARAINKESGFNLPLEFYAWNDMLGEPQPDEEEQSPPDELAPDAVRDHPEWLDKGQELLELPTCRYWILDAEDVEPYLSQYSRSKVREVESRAEGLADLGAKQDEGIVVRRAVREIVDEKRAPRLQRRLDETALVLWGTGQQEEARWAAAAALALAEGTPPEEIPFLYELVHVSLDLAFTEMLSTMGPEALMRQLAEETASSGIVLPGDEQAATPPDEDLPQSEGGIYLPK